ncbi:MAG: type IV pilus modification protein PilV [Desulfovibrionales bacterium]
MKTHHAEQGYTLLEILISLMILALGLLGLAGLQMQGVRDNHSSLLRSQATFLAADILDRMQANRAQALDGEYDVDLGDAPSSSGIIQTDLVQWRSAIATALPQGDGSIEVDDGTATIVIRWQDVSAEGNATLFRTDTRL